MKFKSILIISLILCVTLSLSLSLSTVSATEANIDITDANQTSTVNIDTVDTVLEDSNNLDLKTDEIKTNTVNSLSSNENNPVNEEKTFSWIQSQINSAKSGDTITLDGTYIGNGEPIVISGKTITLKSTNGATLDANHLSHVFYINFTATVFLENLTLINGNISNGYKDFDYRSTNFTGTITNHGKLTIKGNCYIKDSITVKGAVFNYGGVQYYSEKGQSSAILTIQGSLYIDNCNSTYLYAVAIYNFDNGQNNCTVLVTGSLNITNCYSLGNSEGIIYNEQYDVDDYLSTFNVTGSIYIENCESGHAIIQNDYNTGDGSYSYLHKSGVMSINNGVFKNNRIINEYAYNYGTIYSNCAITTVNNCTFINNSGRQANSIYLEGRNHTNEIIGNSKVTNCNFISQSDKPEIIIESGDVYLANNTYDTNKNTPCIQVEDGTSHYVKIDTPGKCTMVIMNNDTDITYVGHNYKVKVNFYDINNNLIQVLTPKQTITIDGTNYTTNPQSDGGNYTYCNYVGSKVGNYTVSGSISNIFKNGYTVKTGTLDVRQAYSLTELRQTVIDAVNAKVSTLVLDKCYTYNPDTDKYMPTISIGATIKIVGNGTDGKISINTVGYSYALFSLSTVNKVVTFENIEFISTTTSDIRLSGSAFVKATIINCTSNNPKSITLAKGNVTNMELTVLDNTTVSQSINNPVNLNFTCKASGLTVYCSNLRFKVGSTNIATEPTYNNGTYNLTYTPTNSGDYTVTAYSTDSGVKLNNIKTGALKVRIPVNIIYNDSAPIVETSIYCNNTIYGKIVDGNKEVPNGTISITVNGEVFYGVINDTTGAFAITFNSTSACLERVPIVFESADKSKWDDTNSTFNLTIRVNPINTEINVKPSSYDYYVGQEFNITGTVKYAGEKYEYQPNLEGIVKITINGINYNATVDSLTGNFSIPVTVLTSLDNYFEVLFVSKNSSVWGDSASDYINVKINKVNTNIYVANSTCVGHVNETLEIKGIVNDTVGNNATGTVNLTFNGEEYTADVVDGQFTLKVNSSTKVDKANYVIRFTSNDSSRWIDSTTNISIEILERSNVDVNITASNITYGSGSPIDSVEVVIYKKNTSEPVGDKDDVSFIIYDANGVPIDNSTWANLAAGNYSVMAVFAGNDNYNPANSTKVNFTINQAIPNIVFGPINNVIKGTTPTFTANATDNNDQFIAEITNFTIYNGETPVTTPWNQLAPGNYTVVATYEGNENYTSKSENRTFRVVKNVNVTVVATNITYGQVPDFTATVVDAENGTIIDTEDIYFIVFDSNNDEVDESEWNNLNVGTYKVMAHFNGNELYVAKSSENETFTVNNANIKSIDIVINNISYGNEFVININNAIGVKDELLNGTVNLTISKKNSNGDKVYEFNVTNGAGSYTISDLYAAGDYDFNVKFNAPNYNEKDINIENVNVAKITPTVIITVEDVEYNHTLPITSTVTGLNGVILDNSSVELHIFNATGEETDKKPLPVGNYTVYATYISNNENYTDANSTDKEFEVYDTAAKISIVEDLYESVVGQKVNITLNLTKKVEGDYIELYISNFDSNRIDIDDFIEGSDGNYYYNYTVDTTGFTKTIIGIAAKLFNENDEPISNALSKLKINFTVPKINTTNIIGNYSDKVNVTFTITNGSDGDIVVLHHIDGINLTTTVKDNKAIFTDVYLSKFGEYTTEVIYTRNNVGLSTVNVNWNISKLPTNITFNPANVTGDVSEILSVNVTVKDSKNNTVSTGKITVTDSKIKLVYENGTDYDGNVYNLTNGSVKIWFKYLEEGVYTPEFNYTNPNSTYGNTNNYLYSSEELNVVINKSSVNITVYTDYRNVSGKVYDNITIMGKVLDNLKNVPEGTISITVNGITFNGTINSTTGEYKIIINSTTNFTDTNIPINFTSGNTTRWLDTESTSPDVVNVTINLINTNVVVNPLVYNKTATQSFNITGTVTSIGTDLIPTGNVTIKIDDTYYNATVGTDGNFTIEITNGISKAGNWTNLNVTFTSSQPNVFANNESASNINITINTLNTTIYVTNGPEFNGSVYETITITGNVTATNGEAAEGNVTMIINGKTFNATVGTDGKFTLKVNSTTKLDKQAYNITFTSNNNARWANSIGENITNITVFALNTTINITSDKIVIKKVNETYYINGTITDDIYNKGVNGTVTITVNEKTYNTTTNENGEFSFTLNSTTSFGPENCTVSFKNNNSDVWNDPENEYVNITIERLNTYINIISYNESVYVGQTITLKGNVTDENNNPVSGITTILYWPEGSGTESTTTNENGEFTIEITCQNAHEMADYTVESYFTTSNVYNNPENQTISYEIKKLPTTVSVDNITYTGKVNSTITITGTVNDTIYNNPANGTVSLTLNDKEFNTTLVNGKYSLNVSCNVSGTYRNIVVKYKTNNNTVWENSTSEKITIKIETLTVYITSNYDLESEEAYNGTFNRLRNYTFNVTDEKGNAVLNGTLNLNLDNETLTTNVTNGQATFKNVLFNDTGLFNFIVDYVGNKFYKSAFNFTKINVAKVATTIYINSSINDNNKVLNITVKDNIDNKTVIKGTIYYVTPDGQEHELNLTNGSTTITVVANRTGEYDIAVSYYDLEQDYLYSEQDFKYNITVAGIETQFQGITDPSNGANGNKLLITSIVRSDKGDIIKEGIIDYLINGKKYSVTLNNGVTNLEVPFDGPTQVIAKYTGKDCTQPKEVYIIEPSFENENIDLTTLYLK